MQLDYYQRRATEVQQHDAKKQNRTLLEKAGERLIKAHTNLIRWPCCVCFSLRKILCYCFCVTYKRCIINTINKSTTNNLAAFHCSAPLPAQGLR